MTMRPLRGPAYKSCQKRTDGEKNKVGGPKRHDTCVAEKLIESMLKDKMGVYGREQMNTKGRYETRTKHASRELGGHNKGGTRNRLEKEANPGGSLGHNRVA